ncbi:M24 family metallopeptidase [Brevibacillus sp. SYSU BS000544]|uniref:M24 family metallopeptidase n=1 Tax=Brevibacillus sp. SYSU BS000544 TaxID=3416443 RepID=UPI003CE4C2BD
MTKQAVFDERIRKLRELMDKKQLDGLLLRKRRSFSWLTSGQSNYIVQTTEQGVSDFLIFSDRVICITNQMESARIKEEEMNGLDVEWLTTEWHESVEPAIVARCQNKRMGTDTVQASSFLPDVLVLGTEIAKLSYVLNEDEQNKYRWLCQASARAIEATCREIQPGMTEFQIQALLASKVMAHGINPQVLLVATDDRILNYRHPIPTAKKLDKYAMLVLCGEKFGLVANVTRFVHFGPLPEEIRVNKAKLAQIDVSMNAATRPGKAICEVFNTGIESYRQMGFPDDWRYLHQGGPTGYASREFLATSESPGVVQLHQAFAWNPAIRGIKSEDTILVGEQANEFLTYTGEWGYLLVERDGVTYKRPDVLVLS